MIKAIIFDFGDVLSKGKTLETLKEYEDRIGMSAEEATKRVVNSNFMKKALKGEISHEEFMEEMAKALEVDSSLVREIGERADEARKLNEDVMRIVKSLRGKYKLAVLSDNFLGRFEFFVDKFDLKKYFDVLYNSAKLGTIKEEKKAFNIVLKDLKVKPEECVFIDNREPNIDAAKSLGFNTTHFKDAEQLKNGLIKLGVKL